MITACNAPLRKPPSRAKTLVILANMRSAPARHRYAPCRTYDDHTMLILSLQGSDVKQSSLWFTSHACAFPAKNLLLTLSPPPVGLVLASWPIQLLWEEQKVQTSSRHSLLYCVALIHFVCSKLKKLYTIPKTSRETAVLCLSDYYCRLSCIKCNLRFSSFWIPASSIRCCLSWEARVLWWAD
jgi:hypothetical protein